MEWSSVRRGARRRLVGAAMLGVAVVSLSGCSSETKDEWKRIAMPPTVTKEGASNLALWQGAWIAAMVTGVITWGLIFYAMWRFRRRSVDDIPVQTRYNLPLEIFYTIAPVLMCIVFFTHTVKSQDVMLDQSNTTNTIEVTGQQWSWTFNYGLGERNAEADDFVSIQKEFPYSSYAIDTGTASYIPTIWLPVDVTTRFNLHSPDVIHDFGVPSFHMRMDVVPGRVNHYAVTPTKIGDYVGKCYELCGVSHSRMLFNVKVVSQADYDNHLEELVADGAVHDTPLLGGSLASTQAGLIGDSE